MSRWRQAPIVKAAPAVKDRPTCRCCKRKLQPYYVTTYERLPPTPNYPTGNQEPSERNWNGRYHGVGHFCTNSCAIAFACAVTEKLYGKAP